MVLKIPSLSIDVLKILHVLAEAEKNPAIESYEPTEEEMKLLADFRDPGVQDAFFLGLVQLNDALLRDMTSKGPLPASVLEVLGPIPPATDPNAAINPSYYPNAFYSNALINLPSKNQNIAPAPRQEPSSPPRSGATRRLPSKRRYNTDDSPFSTCQWDSCGQAVENSNAAIISHLLLHHRIDLKSRNGTMDCGWTGCGENLLITSLAKHITSTHLRLTVVECPYCPDNRHFSRGDSLNAHIKAQHATVFDDPSRKKLRVQ